ncbi:hypothetical protein FE784_14250 [Paenibacillus hemerocallicola]|uniref:Uncharacterized protein n=1 Tax=Paenibacillus hemerocallicola TaxID=1172614 RepID=A0A5C4T9B8_9BACL|nr:hypothetical protein [Paenibacillus hemerocallicola]TNJ65581.1 hypothetical protein FE784_14250 [Paenibacillus hemerocallicola]
MKTNPENNLLPQHPASEQGSRTISRREVLAALSVAGAAAAAGMMLGERSGFAAAADSSPPVHSVMNAVYGQNPDDCCSPLAGFDHVAEMKLADLPAGKLASTVSYYAGWAASPLGPLGGALYDIVAPGDFAGTPDGYGDHVLVNGNIAVIRKTGGLLATRYGAKGDDGATDSYPQLQAMALQLKKQGGGTAVLDWAGGAYGIGETITLWNNTTFGGPNWLKIIAQTTYDCAVTGVPGAKNVHITELKVDGGLIPAQGGLYLRRNNTEWHAGSITVKNAAHSKSRKGGRAVTCEAGVNPGLYGGRKAVIGSIIAIDCYMALCLAGGTNQEDTGVVVNSLVAERCETVIGLFGNSAGYPHPGVNMQHVVGGVAARNCGKAVTYARPHGAFVSDRGSNVRIGSLSLHNDPAYGTIGSLFMGDWSNVAVDGATFIGDCGSLLSFTRFFEADTIADDVFATLNCAFKGIKHVGTCANTVTTSKADDLKVRDTELGLATDTVTSGLVLTPAMAAKTTVYCSIQNRQHHTRIEGFASAIGSSALLSDYSGASVHYGLTAHVPAYPDDASAGTGGLSGGRLYKTSAGDARIKL